MKDIQKMSFNSFPWKASIPAVRRDYTATAAMKRLGSDLVKKKWGKIEFYKQQQNYCVSI